MWEDTIYACTKRCKAIAKELTSTYDIPSLPDLPSSDPSADNGADGKSIGSSKLATPLDSNAPQKVTDSRVLGSAEEEGAGGMTADGEESDDDSTDVSFSNLGALGDGTQVLKKFMNPLTFAFRQPRREEHYFRTHLLPNRVLHLRLLAFLQLLQYCFIMWPTYRLRTSTDDHLRSRFSPAYVTIWVVSAVLWLFLLSTTLWKRGKIYIWLCLRSRKLRYLVVISEIVAVSLAASWDYFLGVKSSAPVGAISTIPILYFAISSGFASTYRQGIAGILCIGALCIGKLAWIAAYSHSVHPVIIYLVPLVITIIVAQGLVLAGDRNRRISYIKYQVVEDRLAQTKLERMKTDYLLSLSLPKSIVSTLREVGSTNFDLIAKRILSATVMFGDLKNFKEVASTLGSTKEALTLLNGIFQYMDEVIEEYEDLTKIKTISTKILFVGGLQGSKTHPFQMIDMAVQMRDYFSQAQTYTIGDQQVPIKLDIEFGVATGPLVAGIVGRKKFVYEIYGDVVNTASRMCSLAHEDQIVITEKVHNQVNEAFETEAMGTRAVKGKGVIPVYSVGNAIDDGEVSFDHRFKRKSMASDEPLPALPARLTTLHYNGQVHQVGNVESILGHRKSIRPDTSVTALERCRSIPAISGKHLDQYVSASALSGLGIERPGVAANPSSALNKFLSGSSALAPPAGIMDTQNPAKKAMDVAKLGSPLTLAKTARTGLTHVDREWEGRRTVQFPAEPTIPETGPAGEEEEGYVRPPVDYGRRKSVKNILVAETVEDPDAKEVLLDVVKRMGAKVDFSTATGLSYMKIVASEIDPLRVRFKHQTIERCYRGDLTADTSSSFIKAGAIALLSEILLFFLAIYNAVELDVDLVSERGSYYTVLALGIASVGLQGLVTGVTVMSASDDQPPDRDFLPRQIMFFVVVTTFFIACLCTTLPWSLLYTYPFLCGCVIPHLAFFFVMRIEGVLFTYRIFASVISGATLVIIQQVLHNAVWQEAVCVLLSACIWVVVFYLLEWRNRVDYLIDLILETQAELVTEEIEKSAGVLHSILPQAVILKLLEDPTTIAYEEMEMVTVLHMDIAGFTSMSSNLEPLTIVKVLNTLFTFFDHLTEEYGVEKITTIGDAYVACSSLSDSADPKVGALSICLVALQMQAYLETQLNMSAIVRQVIKNPLKMRIGLHTGPAHGAIMGGPKNFRYDVMGDTVINAEKTQERCPVGEVSITSVTYNCVREYHGFSFIPETHPGLPSSLRAYTLKAADERIVQASTDSDHDIMNINSTVGMPPASANRSRSASVGQQKRPPSSATRKTSAADAPGIAGGKGPLFGAPTAGRRATTLAKIHPTMDEEA
ncbi:hypothetical protein HKX48_001743 [Thoreauomyces humboldtii]|nr:hypothetical protein HKX48_001743 [Thoreauomyces humboldtii]